MPVTKTQLIGGKFQDSKGNILSNGALKFKLSQDSSIAGIGNIAAGVEVIIQLDSDGNVASSTSTPTAPNQYLWANDVLTTPNTFYRVTGYSSQGQPVWGPNNQQITSGGTGGGTFDVGTWIPNTVFSWTPSPQLTDLEVNGTPNGSQTELNLVAGSNVTLTDNGSGTVTIASSGSTFSTSNRGWFAGPGMTDASSILMNSASNHLINYSANTVVVFQFVLQAAWSLSKASYQLTATGGAGSKFSFGIYSAAGAILVNSGVFDGTISTLQTNSFTTVVLAPGTYYFAVTSTDSAIHGPCAQVGSVPIQLFSMMNASASLFATAANAATSGVLPSTLGALSNASGATVDSLPLPIWKV